MKIAFIVEGESEKLFLSSIRGFLQARCEPGKLPRLVARPLNSNVPPRSQLLKLIRKEFNDSVDFVIVLTDVKGRNQYKDANDAIQQIETSLKGLPQLNKQVFVHAAQYEIEAWLIPFWPRIQSIFRSTAKKPRINPEQINHDKPPSKLLSEVARTSRSRKYSKTLHLETILKDQDLAIAANECPGLKALLNRILELSGANRF